MDAHTLYFCNRRGAPWDGPAQTEVEALIASAFESFTIYEATGYFRARRVPTLCVMIATDDRPKLIALAHRPREHLEQEAVGLNSGGWYERVTG